MSVNYVNKLTGDLIRVAGQGKAEYGASTERKGDITIPATTAGNFQTVNVVFAQAMPDNDYVVVIDEGGETWAHGTTNVTNKTATGFTLFFLNVAGSDAPQMTFKYRAFKLYTDTEYNNLLNNAVLKSDLTDAVTNGDMNPVTSNAVYDTMNDIKIITPTPVTGGAAGIVSWDNFDAKKLGKLVNININGMRHSQDVSIPGAVIIATGLPRPALGRIYLAGINYGDDGNRASAYIDADGNLGIDTGFLLATSQLYGSCCYMSV